MLGAAVTALAGDRGDLGPTAAGTEQLDGFGQTDASDLLADGPAEILPAGLVQPLARHRGFPGEALDRQGRIGVVEPDAANHARQARMLDGQDVAALTDDNPLLGNAYRLAGRTGAVHQLVQQPGRFVGLALQIGVGAGNRYNNTVPGLDAAANLGNGGQGSGANAADGGTSYSGGNGGSGIVIVRYALPAITVSPSTLNFGSIVFVGTTNVLTNTVSGTYLTDNITMTVSPSSVYAISTNAVDYFSTLTLTTNASGAVPATNIYVRFTPTEAGPYPGAITNISGSATQVVTLVATAIPIQPLLHDASPASLNFGNVITNKASASPLTVSGDHLADNVTVTAPSSYFTLSADNVTFSDSPLVLTTNAVGTVNSNIWVRFIPTAAVNYGGAITNISGSLTQTVAVAGTGVVPVISVSTALNFNNVITNATSNLTYTVSGSNLQADVALSVPESTGFTIKTNGGAFGTSVTLAVPNKTELAGGTLSAQTITVQFAPTAVQTYPATDITAVSAGAVSKTTTLTGNGVMPPPTVSITAPSANQLFNIGTPVSLTATVVPGNAPYGVRFYTNRFAGGYGQASTNQTGSGLSFTASLGVLTSGTYHVYATVTDSVSSVTYTSAVSTFIVQPAVPAGMLASGGDQTYITNLNGKVYGVHVFKTTDIAGFVPQTALTKVEYLVVGGGAGGGGNNKYPGGGGGAGGMLTGTVATAVSPGTYTIVVGAGGAGTTDNGANGGNSYAFSNSVIEVMAKGGGGGGQGQGNGLPGGSGGGGGAHWGSHGAFGTGTIGQGKDGGTGASHGGSGGGGGKGDKGGDVVDGVNTAGAAGPGTNCSISGVSMTYATGGAGNIKNNPVNGTAAAANLGNGGQGAGANNGDGGNSYNGGNGGSGIVIIRYDMTPPKGTVIMMR